MNAVFIELLALAVLPFVDSVLVVSGGGCHCQAIDDNNRNILFHDFGLIQACTAIGLCDCSAAGIRACKEACDKVAETWALLKCPAQLREREVRAKFLAGNCKVGLGDNTHNCRVRQCAIPCPRPAIIDMIL